MTDKPIQPDVPTPARTLIVRSGICTLVLIAVFGFIMGFVRSHAEHGGDWSVKGGAILLVAVVVACALLVRVIADVVALLSGISTQPRRERASSRWLVAAMALGLVGGVAGSVLSTGTDWFAPGSRSMPPLLALGIVLPMLTLGPWMTWRWWRMVDEHEQSAYADGANVSAHFAFFGGFTWWFLAKADLVPQPDMLALMLAMSFVWTGVWLRRKFG